MRNPLSSFPWINARAVPFLPAPRPVASAMPPICACGVALDLEMEMDEGCCVDCSFRAAVAAYGGQA